jgi:TldD protein
MTTEMLAPETFFLERFGLTQQTLERTLGAVLGRRIDYADLYFEYRVNEEIGLEEGIVKQAAKNISQGVGVRATAEEKTGFAYSDEITVPALQLAAERARYIAAEAGESAGVAVRDTRRAARNLYPVGTPPTDVPIRAKVDLLGEIDRIARTYDPRITKVMASVASENRLILVATSEGWAAGDVRPLCRLHVTCIAEDTRSGTPNRQVGTYGGGARAEYDFFLDGERYARFAREAARQAIVNPGRWTWSWVPAGRASSCMKRWDTVWRAISTGRERLHSADGWARGWRPACARWSTTGRSPAGAARSTWTTRGRRRSGTF